MHGPVEKVTDLLGERALMPVPRGYDIVKIPARQFPS